MKDAGSAPAGAPAGCARPRLRRPGACRDGPPRGTVRGLPAAVLATGFMIAFPVVAAPALEAQTPEEANGTGGPGAALERALRLLEGGAFADGIAALEAALPEMEPSRATEALELSLALSELTVAGGRVAAGAAALRHRGRAGEAVDLVRRGLGTVPAPDRPALLALGARVADEAGLPGEAAEFRRRIVTEHRDAREFPEAALRLARAVAADPGGRDEAAGILEALIVERPESPVAPDARRELERIRAMDPQ